MSDGTSRPWNAYPALVAAGAFAAGIVAAHAVALPLETWLVATGLIAASLVTAFAALVRSAPRTRLVTYAPLVLTTSALSIIFSAGAVRLLTFNTIPAAHVVARFEAGEDVVVSGRVIEAPPSTSSIRRLTIAVDSAGYAGASSPATGLVHVVVRATDTGGSYHQASVCERVTAHGLFERHPGVRNPGDFDYARYLHRQRIHARLQTTEDALVRNGRPSTGLACTATDVRTLIRARLHAYVPDSAARAVAEALILGDRRSIDSDVREQFTRTGLLHLLAVSGLHVMVVGMILYTLLRPLLMRTGLRWRHVEILRTCVTAIVLLGYLLISGGAASVVRAVVMAILFMGSSMFQRASHGMNTLGGAALILLAWRPVHLFEPGFQLSMAAVAAIITLHPPSQAAGTHRSAVLRYVFSSIRVTVAATAGTLPVLLYHFGRVSFAGLVLNLVAVPLTTATLSSSVASVVAGMFSDSVGSTLGHATVLFARLLLAVADEGERFLGWTYVRWELNHPGLALVVALLVVACAQTGRARRFLTLGAFFVLLAILWTRILCGFWRPHMDVVFLDVGHGDAAVITHSDGTTLLVDMGPKSLYTDAGAFVVAPFLHHKDVRRIHAAIVTHPHSDHLGGLPFLLRSFQVDRVVHSGVIHETELYAETTHLLDSLNIPHTAVVAGDTIFIGDHFRVYVLYPTRTDPDANPNDHSVVVRVQYGETSFLLMGDAPAEAERAVARYFGDVVAADVLKVGHHGSRTSSSPAFLSRLIASTARPPAAVLSVAARNRYGLPDATIVRRLEESGFVLFSTATDGAIWFRSDGRSVRPIRWR